MAAASLLADWQHAGGGALAGEPPSAPSLSRGLAACLAALVPVAGLAAAAALNRDIFIRLLCLQLCFAFMTCGGQAGDVAVAANAGAAQLPDAHLPTGWTASPGRGGSRVVGRAIGRRDRQGLWEAIVLNLGWAPAYRAGLHPVVCLWGGMLIRHITRPAGGDRRGAHHQLPWLGWPVPAAGGLVLPAGRGLYQGHPGREMRNSMLVAVFAGFFQSGGLQGSGGVAALWAQQAP